MPSRRALMQDDANRANDQVALVNRVVAKPAGNLPGIARLRSLAVLQVVHLGLIVAVSILYAWLMLTFPNDDRWRERLTLAVSLSGAAWSAAVLVEYVRTGAQGSLKERLLRTYRTLLQQLAFLCGSSIVLGAVVLTLVYVLLGFGPVHFVSGAGVAVTIHLDDPKGEAEPIGTVPAGQR